MTHQRTHEQSVICRTRLRWLVHEPVDVDEVRWRRQAHVQDRNQALPTGQDLGVLPELGQEGVHLPARRRTVIRERRRLHRATA